MAEEMMIENTSGKGKDVVVPDEVAKKFNWGAFFLSWIWGLGNATYLPLIILAVAFIPFIGGLGCLGLAIWFGIKGNEWAWQNKQFPSVEAFHEYQKKWAIAGIIVACLGIVWMIVSVLLFGALLFAGSGTN